MKKIKILFNLLILCLQISVLAQNQEARTMRSFVPKSQAYDIYYPLNFKLVEDTTGIVTFTDTLSGLNITLSSYTSKKKTKEVEIITLLNTFINDSYKKNHKIEDWHSYKTKFDNVVELKTNFENTNWIWYGINRKKSMLILSINKDSEITEDEINLVRFMIDLLIIN